MNDSIFKSGSLEIPTTASPFDAEPALDWLAFPGNRILMVAAILLLFAALSDYLLMLPHILRCLTRPREHVHIQHNMSLVYTRNYVALTLTLPFCLMSDRYLLYTPSFAGFVPAGWSVAVPAVAILAYLLLRRLLFALVRPPRFSSELEQAYHFALYNLYIALVSLMLLTLAALLPFGLPDMTMHSVLLAEIGFAFALTLLHTAQILSLHCSALGTILYLCALELIPAGLLLYSALR